MLTMFENGAIYKVHTFQIGMTWRLPWQQFKVRRLGDCILIARQQ